MRIVVRKKSNPVYTRLSIWVNGGLITEPFGICLGNEEADEFIARLKPDSMTDEEENGIIRWLDKVGNEARTEIGTALDGIRTTLYAKKLGGIIWPKGQEDLDDIIQEVEVLMDRLEIPYPLGKPGLKSDA